MVFIPISDDNPLRSIQFQWVTVSLIAANSIVFLLGTLHAEPAAVASFALVPSKLFGGAVPFPSQSVQVPEALTLVTYQFVHGDIFHSFPTCCSCGCSATTSRTRWATPGSSPSTC